MSGYGTTRICGVVCHPALAEAFALFRQLGVNVETMNQRDFSIRLWTIPAEHMKAGKEHVVPLADALRERCQPRPRRSLAGP